MRVLIVEDERDLRENLAEVLEQEGHTVATAENGAVGLERARAFRPQLILLDLMMPVMTGHQFLDVQRTDPALAGIPVIVVSAAVSPSTSAAVVEYVSKPFNVFHLLSSVQRAGAPAA